uniref:Uncharacterized protein n=1 Tax=candidate division WOR-3 bacterium TaxID=2052148 RepID=A0A7C4U7P0_UNCW3
MRLLKVLPLIIIINGCLFEKRLWLYVSFEYSQGEGGWFSGYIESSSGKSVKDVKITIDTSYTFNYVDTLRIFLNDYVFPGNEFSVLFEADGYDDATCNVKIPEGIYFTQFDGILSLSDTDGDTIIWSVIGEKPDAFRVMIYKGYNKIYEKNLRDTTLVIYPDVFTFSGNYNLILIEENFSQIKGASSNSVVAGVYRVEKDYTITNK